jgi:hypothetical protein
MKQNRQHRIVVFLTCMAALLLSFISGNAVAGEIYSWTDKNGVVHYGDRPPEGQKTQIVVVPQAPPPDSPGAYPSPVDAQPGSDSSAADATNTSGEQETAPLSLADQRREQFAKDRKEKREAGEDAERMCAKHRRRLTQMEPARRVFYTNEKGESVRMDDDLRIELIEEDKVFIAENCK